jgi:GPI mannosyltransferase 3
MPVIHDGDDLPESPELPVPALQTPFSRWDKFALGLLCLLALGLRLYVGINSTYVTHPDETWDYLEQGFRLASGYGFVTWTYLAGVRPYLFPGIIAGVIRFASWIDDAPATYLNAVAGFMALLSLSTVICGFIWGRRAGGLTGAIITGFITTIWFELIYFAPRTLTEVMAANFLVVAVCLFPEKAAIGPAFWRWFWLGSCLGLTFCFRVQLAPAIMVAGLWLLARHGWRVALGTAAAAALPIVAVGLMDWMTYTYPFQTFYRYVWANTAGGVAGNREPLFYLFDLEISYLGGTAALIGLLCLIGAVSRPLPLLVVIAILATHTLIPHKEYRFIYPALPFIFILAGIGTTRLVEALGRAFPARRRVELAAVAMGLWAFASGTQAIEGPFRREWLRNSGILAAAQYIAARKDVCGISGYKTDMGGGGLVRFHHNVPVFWHASPERFLHDAESFNVVIAPDDNPPPGNRFSLAECWNDGWNEASLNRRRPRFCVYVRPGSCRPGAVNDPDPTLKLLPNEWYDDGVSR